MTNTQWTQETLQGQFTTLEFTCTESFDEYSRMNVSILTDLRHVL